MLRFILFGISLVIIAALISYGNPSEIFHLISSFDIKLFLLLVFFEVVAICIKVFRFKYLLERKHPVSFSSLMPIYIYGMSVANVFPGRLSEPVRAVLLKVAKGVPVTFSVACIFFERLSDILVVFGLSIIAFFSVNAEIFSLPFTVVFLGILSVVFASQLKFVHKFIFQFIEGLDKITFLSNVMKKAKTIVRVGLSEVKLTRAFLIPVFLSFLIWAIIYPGVYYFALKELGKEVDFLVLVGFFSLSVIVGLVSFLPGGFGSMEAAMAALLVLFGVEYTVALSSTLIFRIATSWDIFIAGPICSLLIEKKKIKIRKSGRNVLHPCLIHVTILS